MTAIIADTCAGTAGVRRTEPVSAVVGLVQCEVWLERDDPRYRTR